MSCITYINNDPNGVPVTVSGRTCGGIIGAYMVNYGQAICMDNDYDIITCGNADIGAECLPPVTPTQTPLGCFSYTATKLSTFLTQDVITYTDCNGNPQSQYLENPPNTYPESVTFCAIQNSLTYNGSQISVITNGSCITPTPTITPSKTPSSTPTNTPTTTSTSTNTPTPSVTIGLTPTSTSNPTPTPTTTPSNTPSSTPASPTQTPTQTTTTTKTPTQTGTSPVTPTPTPTSGETGAQLFVYAKYINNPSPGELQYSLNSGTPSVEGPITTTSCDYMFMISGLQIGDDIEFSDTSTYVIASSTTTCPSGPGGFGCSTSYSVLSTGTQYVYLTIDGNSAC